MSVEITDWTDWNNKNVEAPVSTVEGGRFMAEDFTSRHFGVVDKQREDEYGQPIIIASTDTREMAVFLSQVLNLYDEQFPDDMKELYDAAIS